MCSDCVISMDSDLKDGRFGSAGDFLFLLDDKKFTSFGSKKLKKFYEYNSAILR